MSGSEPTSPEPASPEPASPEPASPESVESGAGSEAAEAELLDEFSAGQQFPDPAGDATAALGGLDFASMLQMAQDMSARVGEAQAELAAAEVEGSAGGGLVRVVLNGHLHLRAVHVDPSVCDPDDPGTLEDLLLAAWSSAHDEVAKLQAAADPMGGLGGLGDLGGLLGGT